jgi:hypothetical protein
MKRYAEVIGFTEEEASRLFKNAEINGAKFFLVKPFMVLSGTRNYLVEFMCQQDLNTFNEMMKLLFIEKRGERWVDLLYTSEERAEKVFEIARQNGVQFRILSVEGKDDELRNYRIKMSQKDLNKFRKIFSVR